MQSHLYDTIDILDNAFYKKVREAQLESTVKGQEIMKQIMNNAAPVELIHEHRLKFFLDLIIIRNKAAQLIGNDLAKIFFWISWFDSFEEYIQLRAQYNIKGFNSFVGYYMLHNFKRI